LPEPRRAGIVALLASDDAELQRELLQARAEIDGHLALLASPPAGRAHGVVAVLQKSIRDSIAPFEQLRDRLVLIALAGLALSVVGSIAIAGGIARPIGELARIARRIA